MKMYKKTITFAIATIIVFCFVVSCTIQNNQEKEINYLIKKLSSEVSMIRKEAVNEIPKYGNKAVNSLSELLLENQNEDVQKDVIQSLSKIKSEESATALIHFFKQKDKLSNEVNIAFASIGKPAVKPLFNAYRDKDYRVRKFVIGALYYVRDAKDSDEKTLNDIKIFIIKAFTEDSSIPVRMMALPYLKSYKDDEDVKPILENALKDENNNIREIAAHILNSKVIKESQSGI